MSVSLATRASRAASGARTADLASLPWPSPTDAMIDLGGSVQRFAADQSVYGEGEEARHFYKVISGTVRTCQFLSDGRRQIDAFYHAGDVFGIEAGSVHRLAAEAVTDCTLFVYRRRGLEALVLHDDCLSRWFFGHALHAAARAQEHGLLLGRASATQKVAAFLLEMAEVGDSGTIVDLPMCRQDIADYLGLTIETVSRTLSHMEKDRIITLPSPRRVVLKDRRLLQGLND